MAPPDFPKATVETLAKRAAFRCSNPDCNTLGVGPHSEDTKSTNIGEAAHICGARLDAARYRAEMVDAERANITNGIWLCRTCHGLIDRDPAMYRAELLLEWKRNHEANILSELGTPGDRLRQAASSREIEPFTNMPTLIQEIIRNKGDFWEYLLTVELLDHYLKPHLRAARDLERGVVVRARATLDAADAARWLQNKLAEVVQAPRALKGLFDDLQSSWGAPGVSGDVSDIDHVCKLYGGVAKHLLYIAEEAHFVALPEGLDTASALIEEAALHLVKRLPELPLFIRSVFGSSKPTGTHKFDLILDVPEGWTERFEEEVAALSARYTA